MIPMKKKSGLAIILGLHPKGGDSTEEHDDESMDDGEIDSAKQDAAQELIDAVHTKDAGKVLEAFKTLGDLCGHEPDGDEPDGSDEHEMG